MGEGPPLLVAEEVGLALSERVEMVGVCVSFDLVEERDKLCVGDIVRERVFEWEPIVTVDRLSVGVKDGVREAETVATPERDGEALGVEVSLLGVGDGVRVKLSVEVPGDPVVLGVADRVLVLAVVVPETVKLSDWCGDKLEVLEGL